MKSDLFVTQIKLLQDRFGEKAFNKSFVDLIWREVCTMNDNDFARTCEVFIGSRPHNKPPLLTEFREARLRYEKFAFERDLQGAAKVLNHPALRKPIAEILHRDFGAVESVKDAFEIARLKLKTQKSDGEGA